MKILVLTSKYYPVKNANELCIHNIIKCLYNVKCSVICFGEKDEIIRLNKQIIYTVEENVKRKIGNIYLKFLLGLPIRVLSLFFKPVFNNYLLKKYTDKFDEIIRIDRPDMIISVLNPIESVEAGYLIKKKYPDIKYIIYDIDTASNCSNGIIERIFRKAYLNTVKKWEHKVFSAADLIIHLKWHKNHFQEDFYKEFLNKTLFLGIPVLKVKQNINQTNNIDFIYAGRFYRNLREPKVLIDIFEKVFEKQDSYLHIYTSDEYVKKIKYYLENNDSYSCLPKDEIPIKRKNIFVHNYIDQGKLDEITENIGFLVSLGNSYTDMFPSKIITYVGSLKPIIHIYQTQDDPVIEFLKKYPDALLIYSKDCPELNTNKIIEFINSDRPLIEPEYIKEVFKDNLPEYNASEIIKFLNKCGLKNE